jgi:methionyl-tRNA formyltransferase
MRVIFLGNHTVGVVALRVLCKNIDVVGVVAHPDDPENGVRYQSVYNFALEQKIPVIRGKGRDKETAIFIRDLSPDLIWVTDYRYILPHELISLSKYGAVNLHPSLLPRYKGRASINWAILNGEVETGLTAHFIDNGVDTGDIIKQETLELKYDDDIGDMLRKFFPVYETITDKVIRFFLVGDIPRLKQEKSISSEYPARKPDDGLIDWTQPAEKIRNLIRAVSHPYPGAFTEVNGNRLYIWKADVIKNIETKKIPGTVIKKEIDSIVIQCGKHSLRATVFSGEVVTVIQGIVLKTQTL